MAALSAALAPAAGALVGCGLFVTVLGLRRAPRRPARELVVAGSADDARFLKILAGAGLALAVVALTGQPVAGVLLAGLVLSLPAVFGGSAARKAEIARIEAISTWTGQLRDLLRGGSGLMETIEASGPHAPRAIRTEVQHLALGMRGGRLRSALGAFAADVDDPMADLVAAALILASTEQAGRLGELLDVLATRTNQQAALRMRIERDRTEVRTQVRGVVLVTVLAILGLIVWKPDLLGAYAGADGQVVLAVVGAAFLGGIAMLVRMGRSARPEGFTLAESPPS